MKAQGPVVVGVDGSEQSRAAASWAVDEARLRRAEVHLVAVNDDPPRDDELWEMLRSLSAQAKAEHPQVTLRERIMRGNPADRLIRRSVRAQLIVVGARGLGTFAAALLGSVSARVAMHAECPVVVVRDHNTAGPIAVGVDGSPHSRSALQFAFDTAAGRQAGLVAVQVREHGTPGHAWTRPASETDQVELAERVQRDLAALLRDWTDKYPDVAVERLVPRGHPAAELAKAAQDAQLLVVGHRGHGGFAGQLLGSVASGVLHHASCPVAVVRDENA